MFYKEKKGVSGVRDREGCAGGQTGRLICAFKRRVNYLCALEEDVYSLQCRKEGKSLYMLQWNDDKQIRLNVNKVSFRLPI